MRKILATLCFITLSMSFAQDVKIKDGIITLDKKEIAKIITEKFVYKISSLDNTYSVTMTKKYVELPTQIIWLELKDEKQNLTNELNFEKFSPFGVEKSVVKTMIIKDFLNSNGLNETAINAFLNGEKNNISEKYLGNQSKIQEENELAASYNLRLNDNGNVTRASNQLVICKIELILNENKGVQKYLVTDANGNLIATWLPKMGQYAGYNDFLNEEIITIDKKVFKVKFDNSGNFVGYKMSLDVTAKNIINKLAVNGYLSL